MLTVDSGLPNPLEAFYMLLRFTVWLPKTPAQTQSFPPSSLQHRGLRPQQALHLILQLGHLDVLNRLQLLSRGASGLADTVSTSYLRGPAAPLLLPVTFQRLRLW